MQDLKKINGTQLLTFWKDLSKGLLVLLCSMFLSQALPYYFSPIVALVGAAVLYTMLYNNRLKEVSGCMIAVYALFCSMIAFTFGCIALNVLYIWGMIELPKELVFFHPPFVPSLILDPICAITIFIIYFRRNSLYYCIDCKSRNGVSIERGRMGELLLRESRQQLLNLAILFSGLSVVVWVYYFINYDRNADINNRDMYIFLWLNLLVIILDELYFALRYYNLYLDYKESGDIITEEELSNMATKTYLRFYVICGNSVYLNDKTFDPSMPYRQIIDTPFVTKRNVNGITTSEVNDIVSKMVGIPGHLRFFYGRKNPALKKHSLLRYFYFIDGTPDDYPELRVSGEWMEFNRIKNIYNQSPTLMSKTMLSDVSRMTTIVLTQKIFDQRGFRKIKTKSYQPTYDLIEIRENDYDFQDDKWIRVAMFNSDTKGFYMRRIWKKMLNHKSDVPWG